jgi:signal transduction histidine kinase/CheY-like chemotaxis protein
MDSFCEKCSPESGELYDNGNITRPEPHSLGATPLIVKPFFTHRLELRLSVAVGFGLLLFAVITGLFNYQQAYHQQREEALELQKQLVATVQTQAEVAVYARDEMIAGGVISGLLASPIISAVRLDSSSGDFHIGSDKTALPGEVTYALYSPLDYTAQVGRLVIVPNEGHIDRMAVDVALHQAGLLLLQVFIAVALTGVAVRLMMLKPINRLAYKLSHIQPGSRRRLPIDPKHAHDQIGELSMSANTLLDIAEANMAEAERVTLSLEEALEKLTEKEQAKSNFFAAASHDLRQPIHAMRLFLDSLRREDDKVVQTQLIDSIEASSQSLNELLDALLDISKLDAGAVVPELDVINIDEVFARLDANFSALALKRKLRFKLWYPQRPLTLHTDLRLLNIILANLTGNALKNTRHGGVLVSFRTRGEYGVFQIWDSGIGIDEEHLERIFEEFYQINNPNRDRAKGLGLGLAIARRVSHLLGYQLKCRSVVNRGTVFEVLIPRAALHAPEQPLLKAADDEPVPIDEFEGKRLVVLEDDTLVATALKEWLLGIGCTVSTYARGEAALAAADIAEADYYIVDYQLAGDMSGVDFLGALRQRRKTPIRAVVVSGNTSTRFIESTELLPWPILFKPADPVAMLTRLAQQG